MFYIKTKLQKSSVHGIGLFADEHVAKGKMVWKPSKSLTLSYPVADFKKLPSQDRKIIAHYGCFNSMKNEWCLFADDIRFLNHSELPNIGISKNGSDLKSLRNIKKGEELLQNYADFEDEKSLRKRGF